MRYNFGLITDELDPFAPHINYRKYLSQKISLARIIIEALALLCEHHRLMECYCLARYLEGAWILLVRIVKAEIRSYTT